MPKKMMADSRLPVPAPMIERRIYVIRGQKVMLDSDLAELYQVPTFRLNEAVKRNRVRFPEDFMFQITEKHGAWGVRPLNERLCPDAPCKSRYFPDLELYRRRQRKTPPIA